MEFDATFFLVAIPAAFIAGVSKGGFGGGPAFAATALMALIMPPATALGIMLPLLMVADLATLRPFWKQWDGAAAKALIYGGLPGVVLGALLYKVANGPDPCWSHFDRLRRGGLRAPGLAGARVFRDHLCAAAERGQQVDL